MGYSTSVTEFKRVPTIIVKITVPGTITGSQTFYFSPNAGYVLSSQIGQNILPYLKSFKGRQTKIQPQLNTTERARMTLAMTDDGNAPDFDSTVFSCYTGGPFWRRLVAAQPYYMGSKVEIKRGFVDPSFPESDFQTIFMGSIEEINFGTDGTVTVICKDNSTQTRDQVPSQISDTNVIASPIVYTDNIFTVTNGAELTDPATLLSKDYFPVQVRVNPDSIGVYLNNMTWTAASHKLSQGTGAFANYNFKAGDTVTIYSVALGEQSLTIIQKPDNDSIVTQESISDTDIVGGIELRSREDINISTISGNVVTVCQNWLIYTEDFTNANWVKIGTATVSGNSAVSPLGGVSADLLNIPAAGDYVGMGTVCPAGIVPWNFSVWVKAANASQVGKTAHLSIASTTAQFTLTAVWQRVEVTLPSNSAASIWCDIVNVAGDTATSLYVWGAALQQNQSRRDFYTPGTNSATRMIAGMAAGRGVCNTDAAPHIATSKFVEIQNYCPATDVTAGVHPAIIIRDLLNKGNIDPLDVDEASFTREQEFVTSATLRRAESAAVTSDSLESLIGEVQEQGALDFWVDETGLFKVSFNWRTILPGATVSNITDENGIIAKTASIQSNLNQSKITRCLVYYNWDVTKAGSNPGDFANVTVVTDAASEVNSGPWVKTIFGKWITTPSDALALAGRIVSRFKRGARLFNCNIDLKDDILFDVGDFFTLNSIDLLHAAGTTAQRISANWQATQKEDDFENGKVSVLALEARGLRYGIIAPAGFPDYDGATDSQRQYAFVGDVNNFVGAAKEEGYAIL